MNQALALIDAPGHAGSALPSCLTLRLDGQWFGVGLAPVRGVLRDQAMTPVPRAPLSVTGVFAHRGRIALAIDLRCRLGLPDSPGRVAVPVMVEHGGETVALLVDEVGGVLPYPPSGLMAVPPNLDAAWRGMAVGIVPLATELLVLLDVARIIDPLMENAA